MNIYHNMYVFEKKRTNRRTEKNILKNLQNIHALSVDDK